MTELLVSFWLILRRNQPELNQFCGNLVDVAFVALFSNSHDLDDDPDVQPYLFTCYFFFIHTEDRAISPVGYAS